MNKLYLLLVLIIGAVISAASASALNITGGTLTLKAGDGFNFSQQRVIQEQNSIATEADIVYHNYEQTNARGLKITRGDPFGALTDTSKYVYHYEINMLKNTGQIEDCISNDYFYKIGISPTLSRAYCVVLDRRDEVLDLAHRRVVRLQVVKLTKDTVMLEWKYLDNLNVPVIEEPAPVEKEEPIIQEASENITVTPPMISAVPDMLTKKIPKKHDWKPWLIGWAIVFAAIVAYEVFWGFGRRK